MDETKTAQHTGWALRLATVMGIPVRVHVTFLLLLVWYGYHSSRMGNDLGLSLAFILIVFAIVVLHELGHATMARRFGVRTEEIVLYPIGGIAKLENIPGGKAELLIALAGPAVNLALLVPLLGALVTVGPAEVESTTRLRSPQELVAWIFAANLMLLVFNLIPAFPMDGGRVLRAALSLRMPPERATDIAAGIGQAVAIGFGVLGLLGQNIILMFIALFVFLGASQEAFYHRQLAAVRGRRAREAMITRFETLAPQDSLSRAADRLLATHQQDFPVIDAWRRVVGVLPRAALLQAMARLDAATPVLEVMDREVPTARPDDDLDAVLQLLRHKPSCPVIVVGEEGVEGMITLENLAEFIEVSRRSRGPSESRGAHGA